MGNHNGLFCVLPVFSCTQAHGLQGKKKINRGFLPHPLEISTLLLTLLSQSAGTISYKECFLLICKYIFYFLHLCLLMVGNQNFFPKLVGFHDGSYQLPSFCHSLRCASFPSVSSET